MTDSRRKTLKIRDMQSRVIGKAMSAAKNPHIRESAKQISVANTKPRIASESPQRHRNAM